MILDAAGMSLGCVARRDRPLDLAFCQASLTYLVNWFTVRAWRPDMTPGS
jgi:hypothetical protein